MGFCIRNPIHPSFNFRQKYTPLLKMKKKSIGSFEVVFFEKPIIFTF